MRKLHDFSRLKFGLCFGSLRSFLGEETSGELILTDAPTWIIDPIDGTLNFVHGLSLFAINVAFSLGKELQFGVTYNPALELMYTARKGEGAFLNGEPIKCSDAEAVSQRSPRNRRNTKILTNKFPHFAACFPVGPSVVSARSAFPDRGTDTRQLLQKCVQIRCDVSWVSKPSVLFCPLNID